MPIAVIIGSPRGMKGNTGRLPEEVLAGLRKDGGSGMKRRRFQRFAAE